MFLNFADESEISRIPLEIHLKDSFLLDLLSLQLDPLQEDVMLILL